MSLTDPSHGLEVVPGFLSGWKAAYLTLDPDGRVGFAGAVTRSPYGPTDLAVCPTVADHVPPVAGCACGFYAFFDRPRAVAKLDGEVVALLDVRMWGRFEEHEAGFYAAAQRVVAVEVLGYCARCLADRDPRLTAVVALTPTFVSPLALLVPACRDHVVPGEAWTLDAVAASLGVEVSWAELDEELAAAIETAARNRYPSPLFPRSVRRVDDLLPFEVAYVFPDAIADDGDGGLWLDVLARLIQPLPGTDIPIRLADDGTVEAVLDEVVLAPAGWRPRTDPGRFGIPVRPIGTPIYRTDEPEEEVHDSAA